MNSSSPDRTARRRTAPVPRFRRVLSRLGGLLGWLIFWFSLTLLIAGLGIRVFFGRISPDQLILNVIAVQSQGGGTTLVWLAVAGIGVLPLVITVLLAVLRARRIRRLRRADRLTRRLAFFSRTVAAVLTCAVVVTGTTAFSSTVTVTKYLEAGRSTTDVSPYYVDPVVTDGTDERSIVVIYLESGEATLGDADAFEKDVYAPLERATSGWASIDDYEQYPGGGWTMAGIVSTQCGVPLKGKIAESNGALLNELVHGLDSYLTNATCFGDVLEQHGYTSVFMGGANPSFAAKDTFLQDHGYGEEYGLFDWQRAGDPDSEFRSDWGLSDQRLMAHAKQQVTELHDNAERTGKPFNLSMLTLDTHEPTHVYDSCDVDTDEAMASVYACSMTQVADFIDYMNDQGYLDDTAVVVMGDHLKQLGTGSAFHDQLSARTDRSIFNRVWIPGRDAASAAPQMRAGADQLSMYPTLLEAAGLPVRGGEAGLGVSAFAAEVPRSSAQARTPLQYSQLVRSRSDSFYRELWGES